MDTIEAIKTRRSIRNYRSDPVDNNTLDTIIEAAAHSPINDYFQRLRFIIVRDNDLKTLLADTIEPNPRLGFNPAAKAIRTAPVVIIVCSQTRSLDFEKYNVDTNEAEAGRIMFDAGIAAQNLSLAATALGLGTVHVGLFDYKKVAALLKIPDSYCVVEMTPLGYPAKQPRPIPRKELSEIVFSEAYGQPYF